MERGPDSVLREKLDPWICKAYAVEISIGDRTADLVLGVLASDSEALGYFRYHIGVEAAVHRETRRLLSRDRSGDYSTKYAKEESNSEAPAPNTKHV